jgi:tetratricopeptide (TPR) repeat protein
LIQRNRKARRGVTLVAGTLLILWTAGLQAHPDLASQIEAEDAQLHAEPDDVAALLKRGDLNRRQQDFAAAAADFAAARSIDPDNAQLDFLQGRLALDTGDTVSAEKLLKEFLVSQPQHPGAWRLLGEAHLALGNSTAAAECFGLAIRLSDTPSPALYRQRVLALKAANDFHRSLVAVDEGLARFGPEINLLGLGADIALAAGQADRSRGYLDQVPAGLERLPQWQVRIAATQSAGH